MQIGIMTNFKKPTKVAELTARMSHYHRYELIYLTPDDVDQENDKVNGRVFINNKWIRKTTDIPPFIDVAPYCFKKENKETMAYLRKKTFLSDDRSNVLTKYRLQQVLEKDENFSGLVIPTERAESSEQIIAFLNLHGSVVIKPIKGIRGKGVYILSQENEDDHVFKLGYQKEKRTLTKEEFEAFFIEEIKGKSFIVQKHVSSRTMQGDPFDCRVHVEKNGHGKWESAKIYIRIGIGQSVISNVNQGGGISDVKQFLQATFEDQWKSIYDKLVKVSKTLPYKIEEIRDTHIMSLGLDIGIDKDGSLYLFEVNDGPATKSLEAEVALLRSDYYKFILEKVLQRDLTAKKVNTKADRQNNKLKKRNQTLQKELDLYKKRYSQLRSSTSWKITAPLRKIGKLRK